MECNQHSKDNPHRASRHHHRRKPNKIIRVQIKSDLRPAGPEIKPDYADAPTGDQHPVRVKTYRHRHEETDEEGCGHAPTRCEVGLHPSGEALPGLRRLFAFEGFRIRRIGLSASGDEKSNPPGEASDGEWPEDWLICVLMHIWEGRLLGMACPDDAKEAE